MKENTAILVSSPFQSLNALEAIKELDISNPFFYIFGEDRSSIMTRDFISKRGYEYKCVPIAKNAFDLIKKSKEYNKYKTIIIGDYFSVPFFLVSMVLIARHGHIIYVDDGNSTLTLLPPSSSKRLYFNGILKLLFYKFLILYKDSKHVSRSFFSFYDIEDKGFPIPVIKNKFTMIGQNLNIIPKDVYIIGTNTHKLQIDREDYISQLGRINKYDAQNMIL